MSTVLTCELSGEALTAGDTAVVTPSGHVCLKRLILQQLTTNGGKDPFEEDRPLSEDELVELKAPKVLVPPPRTSNFTQTLQQLQSDYDAVLLELFDTRKVLAETRQELSLALYQNDAAVRVVARLVAECDQARAALKEGGGGGKRLATAATGAEETEEPATKKMRTVSIPGSIPKEEFQVMSKTWEELHGTRKAEQKKRSKAAPSLETVGKSTSGILELGGSPAADEKTSLVSSDEESIFYVGGTSAALIKDGKVTGLPTLPSTATSAAVFPSDDVVVGLANGSAYRSGSSLELIDGSSIVSITAHPDGTHFVAATANGTVAIGKSQEWLTAFTSKDKSYTVGTLHPDGLIYIAGTTTGSLDIWDFNSQSSGASMDYGVGAVQDVAFSNNAYHIAAAYSNGHVLVWDLRKQSILTTLNEKGDVSSIVSVVFDESGKYLAYSGQLKSGGGMVVCVTTVKRWDEVVMLEGPKGSKACPGLTWNKKGISVCIVEGDKSQVVQFDVSS